MDVAKLQLTMNKFPKIEDIKISLTELKSIIEDWNIKERIRQKISIWGIKNTTHKIKGMPKQFLATSLLYYFMKFSSQIIKNYNDEMITEVGNLLKNIYNQSSINFFKKENNFQYTLVILAKVITYFVMSYFPEKQLNPYSLENDIYTTLVLLLIGYEVGSNTYRIIQLKFKKKNKKQIKNKSNKSHRLICQDNPKEQTQIQQDYIIPSTSFRNIIHRKGVHGLLRETNRQEQKIEMFKGQVRDALKGKNMSKGISLKTIKSSEQTPKRQMSQQCLKRWVKGKNKIMYIDQISAAMSMNKGFNFPAKTKAHIYLSERANIKDTVIQRENNQSNIKLMAVNRQQILLNKPKSRNWSRIIDQMKQQSYCLNSPSKIENIHLNLSCLRKQPLNIVKKVSKKLNKPKPLAIQNEDYSNIKFKKLSNHQDMSIKCNIIADSESKTIRYNSVQKLKSALFLQDQEQFQKTCNNREKHLVSPSSLFFPKIDKK